jgi:hypothetical protein
VAGTLDSLPGYQFATGLLLVPIHVPRASLHRLASPHQSRRSRMITTVAPAPEPVFGRITRSPAVPAFVGLMTINAQRGAGLVVGSGRASTTRRVVSGQTALWS